jgi:transcriptional regulator
MYLPQIFEESRLDVLHELIRSHPFSTFVVHTESGLVANHIPFLLDPQAGDRGTLRGHVARANPVWKQLAAAPEAIAIFQGPDAYITPNWYPSKHEDSKVVPTWNYAVVHAYGRARAVEDSAWLHALVSQLTAEQEAKQPLPWRISDAPSDYTEQMLRQIVGIEIPISRLQGKWKVSQNRKLPDRLGVVAGLESQATDQSGAMAELVRQRAGQNETR